MKPAIAVMTFFFPFLKARSENGAFRHVWLKVFSEASQLRKHNLTEDERKPRLVEAFIEAWRDWANKDQEHEITDEDRYWLTDVTNRLDISDLIWLPLLNHRFHTDYDGFKEDTSELKKQTDNSTEELAALLLTLYSSIKTLHLPPGHPVWLSLGVKNSGEYRALGLSQTFKEAQWAKAGELNRAGKAFITAAKSTFYRQGVSDKLVYKDNILGKVMPDLNDDDCLSQFASLAGIDLSDFAPKEQERILDLLYFHERIGDKSAKTGVSYADYYGERADSEKVQRVRLFHKIKDKTKSKYLRTV